MPRWFPTKGGNDCADFRFTVRLTRREYSRFKSVARKRNQPVRELMCELVLDGLYEPLERGEDIGREEDEEEV